MRYLIHGVPIKIGAHADHATSDYRFERTQSLRMRNAVWERRIPPIKSTLQWFLHGFGVIGFFVGVFALCFFR